MRGKSWKLHYYRAKVVHSSLLPYYLTILMIYIIWDLNIRKSESDTETNGISVRIVALDRIAQAKSDL